MENTIQILRQRFDQCDPNSTGFVTIETFSNVLKGVGSTLHNTQVLGKKFSIDGVWMSYSAFLAHLEALSKELHVMRVGGSDRGMTSSSQTLMSQQQHISPSPPPPSSSRTGSLDSKTISQHYPTTHDHTTTTTKMNLRNVFSYLVYPPGSNVTTLDRIKEIFHARGVKVYDHELEALYESVEETGEVGAPITFVQFCTLVSRMQPRTAQSIRNPETWGCVLNTPDVSDVVLTSSRPVTPNQFYNTTPSSSLEIMIQSAPQSRSTTPTTNVPNSTTGRADGMSNKVVGTSSRGGFDKPTASSARHRKTAMAEQNQEDPQQQQQRPKTPLRTIRTNTPNHKPGQKQSEANVVSSTNRNNSKTPRTPSSSRGALQPKHSEGGHQEQQLKPKATPKKLSTSVNPPPQPKSPEMRYKELCLQLRGRTGNILALCTNIDRCHSGKITLEQLRSIVSTVDTTLTPFDIELLTQKYAHVDVMQGIDFIEFVGGIILQDTPPYIPASFKQQQQQQQQFLPPENNNKEEILHETMDPMERDRIESLRSTMRRMLAEEFAAVLNGQPYETLLTPFVKMDLARCGYISQANLRRGIVRLFREANNRPVPKWLLERCCKIAKLPFQPMEASSSPIENAAHKAATAIKVEYPKEDLVDYRFLFVYLQLLPHTVLPYTRR
eukprot:PhF_6_TR38683/c0_g1_i3/m.57870